MECHILAVAGRIAGRVVFVHLFWSQNIRCLVSSFDIDAFTTCMLGGFHIADIPGMYLAALVALIEKLPVVSMLKRNGCT